MDIWDHFENRKREFESFSVSPDDLVCEAAPDGLSGRIDAKLGLSERVYLSLRERVVIRGGAAVIEKYAYYLIVDGAEAWGEDKAPDHEVAIHGHVGPDHRRVASSEVTLSETLERAWRDPAELYADEDLDEPG